VFLQLLYRCSLSYRQSKKQKQQFFWIRKVELNVSTHHVLLLTTLLSVPWTQPSSKIQAEKRLVLITSSNPCPVQVGKSR